MASEEPRPFLGVAVRDGMASVAVMCGANLRILSLRFDRGRAEARRTAVRLAVRELLPDRDRTTIAVEPANFLAKALQGHVRGLLILSVAEAKRQLVREAARPTHRALYAAVLGAVPEAQRFVRSVRPGQAAASRCNLVKLLATALALAARRIAEQ